MSDAYSLVETFDAERTLSGKSRTEHVDLTEHADLAEMRARVWFLEPGNDRKGTHVHDRQEELYVLLEGDGGMVVDGDELSLSPGDAVRVPPETPRRMAENDTDGEVVWLVVGAPPAENDGTQV